MLPPKQPRTTQHRSPGGSRSLITVWEKETSNSRLRQRPYNFTLQPLVLGKSWIWIDPTVAAALLPQLRNRNVTTPTVAASLLPQLRNRNVTTPTVAAALLPQLRNRYVTAPTVAAAPLPSCVIAM